MGCKQKPRKLVLKAYNYEWQLKNVESIVKEESTDKEELIDKEESVDLSDMLPLEGDEKAKEGKGLKILTLNEMLTRLQMLLAQIKAGNNS